jgi:GDP-4-dehydro-6-deoxy-D-mannose reductase
MKKIFVTGASGFVGKYLISELLSSQKDIQIVGTFLNNEDSDLKNKIKLVKVDLGNSTEVEDLISTEKPDFIFHLAASTSPRDSFNDPKKTFDNNINSEINILEAVRKQKLNPRILITSSAEIYGLVSPENLPINEDTPLNPTNPYAVSKIAQDFLALQYFNSYKFDVIRLRPFNHAGPGQSENFAISAFAKKIAMVEKGELDKITVGNLDSKRDFTDVRDVVKAYVLLSEKGKSGEAYNIGSGKSHLLSEILSTLISLSNKKIITEQDQNLIIPLDNPDLVCDYSKLKAATDWAPQIIINQTLKDTLDYWRGII